eukprot:TRINITY_DN1444_c0_g1_i1.p1 TRINITY_DN1444_c0_g1~~TRINITY_DN1444_c0_g1_i1.p1  ORF type:complete len:533 (-),score=238.42 TRINITY_DN1444_c0_g1_i1:88-1686(-)
MRFFYLFISGIDTTRVVNRVLGIEEDVAPAEPEPVHEEPPPAPMPEPVPASEPEPVHEEPAPIEEQASDEMTFPNEEIYDINTEIGATIAYMTSIGIDSSRLKEKHLSRPPFRFLHDLVIRTMGKTNSYEGLYSEEEMNGKTVNDQGGAAKAAWVKKITSAVEFAVQKEDLLNAKMVVSGKEPSKTNKFLQYFAYSTVNCDTNAAVAAVLGGTSSPPAAEPVQQHIQETAPEPQKPKPAPPVEKPKPKPAPIVEPPVSMVEDMPEGLPQKPLAAGPMIAAHGEIDLDLVDNGNDELEPMDERPKMLARPVTARRKPPKVKQNVKEVVSEADKVKSQGVAVMLEGGEESDDDDMVVEERPQSPVIDAAALEGQHGKLVQEILKERNEENESKAGEGGEDETGKDRGILLKGRKKNRSKAGSVYSQAEIDNVRNSIQSICRIAQPLGRCLQFLPDDLESMDKEIALWKMKEKEYEDDLKHLKEETDRELAPLRKKLADVEEKIRQEKTLINEGKARVARNRIRVKELMRNLIAV